MAWPFSQDSSQPNARSQHLQKRTLRFGPVEIPESEATSHFASLGTTVSGQSIILRLLAQAGRRAFGTGG